MTAPFILSVSNRKGGSAKSTTVVNLAAEWAAGGRRVLVIDLDTQGHAGLGLGIEATKSMPGVHDVFRDRGADIAPVIVATAWPNLWCAPADPLYDGADARFDAVSLRRQLRRPEMAAYDVILLDTPPSLDLILTNAMAAADGVLIPFLAHALSAEGVKQLSRLFYKMVTTVNPDLKMMGLLPVMASPRIGHHRAVIADIGRQFGADRILRPIRTDIQLAAAFAARKPIRHFAPRCRGALDYFLLADELASSWCWPGKAGAAALHVARERRLGGQLPLKSASDL
ncbi:ParA family protein [Telmatospirillum siberiense]|uniref:ParA family protein n=1 Tax=Telmatospirillum siberiense TaxID=382514 RepID=A0A2N3Q1T7_9PROT|nr:ParA family protein [Telmatospirillum siberiense]PKU26613.1 ParA family protein [Telmatospirillum siberiense]